jgi:2-methylcitrate dehydratase
MDVVLTRFAEAITSFGGFATLPDATRHDAVRRVLDTVGCGLVAFHHPAVRAGRALALRAEERPGATLLGTAHRAPPEIAAFVNATAGRAMEGNDAYPGGGGHPSDAILPLLGLAESLEADGEALLGAVWVAYQLHFALFRDLRLRDAGLDHVLYTAVATAGGAARLLGLDTATTRDALALALTPNLALHATRVGELSMWKGAAAGNAGRAGMFAARLAAAGMTGPERPMDGHHGLIELIGPREAGPVFATPDPMRARAAHKFLLSEYHAQGPMLAALELRPQLRIEDIADVEVFTYWFTWSEIGSGAEKWRPTTPEAADHSLPWMIAGVLVDGAFSDALFAPERLGDPRIHALMPCIRVTEDQALSAIFPRAYPCRVAITLRDGRVLRAEVPNPPGHPDNPMTDAQMGEKFLALASRVLPTDRAAAAISWLWALPAQRSLRPLLDLVRVAA